MFGVLDDALPHLSFTFTPDASATPVEISAPGLPGLGAPSGY